VLTSVPINAELTLHDGTTSTMKERWTSDTIDKSRDTLEAVPRGVDERVRG
jgi:hypothetical protein